LKWATIQFKQTASTAQSPIRKHGKAVAVFVDRRTVSVGFDRQQRALSNLIVKSSVKPVLRKAG
jgi:hypothetical protein